MKDGKLTMTKFTKRDVEVLTKQLGTSNGVELEKDFGGAIVMDAEILKAFPLD